MSEQKPPAGVQPIYEIVGYLDRHAPFPIGSLLLGLVGAAYLTNPTAGFLELIPDTLPFVGNLDETGAAFLLLWGGGNFFRWWRVRRAQRKAQHESKEER